MAELTVQNIAITGLEATYAAAAVAGDSFVNDGRTFFQAKNGSVGDITLTFDSKVACDQGFDHNATVVVTAGEERMIGPFTRRWNDENGKVNVTYSGVTTLTVAAIRLPNT